MTDYISVIAIIVGIILVLGIPYIMDSRHQQKQHGFKNKREYVISNLDKFRVKESGSNINKKEIYLVDRDTLGL